MVLGDLNTVTSKNEKNRGRHFRLAHCRAFLNFFDAISLVDLGFSSTMYTWENRRLGVDRIKERLNHALANPSWLQTYPHIQVIHLPKLYSDHCPILVD